MYNWTDDILNATQLRSSRYRETVLSGEREGSDASRLRDRRGRVGGVRPGEPAVGRPGEPGHPDRGRRARPEPAHPHPGRVCETARPSEADLGLHRRARSRRQQPRDPLPARPRARRLVVDQRHDLCPGAARGFRPLGPARQSRLVVGRRAALFQARRELAGGRQRLPRQRRAAVDLAYLRQAGVVREDHRGRRRDRSRIPRGRQPPAAGTRRAASAGCSRPAAAGAGRARRAPICARRCGGPTSRSLPTRWCIACCSTASARSGSSSRAAGKIERGRGAGRGDPVRRRDRLAAYPAIVRGRRSRSSATHRRAGRACAARGRQEFAGPFPGARHGRGDRHPDRQREVARAAVRRRS